MSENENHDASTGESTCLPSQNSQNLNQTRSIFAEDKGLGPFENSSDDIEKLMQMKFQSAYQALKNAHLEQQKRLLEIQSTGVYTNEQKQTQQRALLTKQQKEYQDLIATQKRQFKAAVVERKCSSSEADTTEAKVAVPSEPAQVQKQTSHSSSFGEEIPPAASPERNYFEAGSELSLDSQHSKNELRVKINNLQLSLDEQNRKYSDLQKKHQLEIEALRKDSNNVLAMIVEEHKELCKKVILEERIRIENCIDRVVDSKIAHYEKLHAEQHLKLLNTLDEVKVVTKAEFQEVFESRETALLEKVHKEREENQEFVTSLLQTKVSEFKFDLLEASKEMVRDTVRMESAAADVKIVNTLKIQAEHYENTISSLANKLEKKCLEYLANILESEDTVRRKSLYSIDLFLKSASSILEQLISENITYPINSSIRERIRLLSNREVNFVSQCEATDVTILPKDGEKIMIISKEPSCPEEDTRYGSDCDKEKIASNEIDCKSSDIASSSNTTSNDEWNEKKSLNSLLQ